MKIAILSDFHFGFGSGSERAGDPYEAFREAIEKAMGCDLIIFAGDIFDSRDPDAETLTRAMELMAPVLLAQSGVKLIQGVGKDLARVSEIALMGIPIVAIHGTHERRTRGLLNPVEALEKAGFLIYLHCNGVVFEKDGERVAVHGMSGVPDQYAESVLANWNPSPVHGCFNIFVLHQSITEFLYAQHTLDLKKLPKGFDMYVDGHIHEAKESKYDGKPFLLTGSLVPTQLREEAETPKGFWIIDTAGKETRPEWVELEHQRRVYIRAFENPTAEAIEAELDRILSEKPSKRPLVRLDLSGNFSDTLAHDLDMKFGSKLLLSLKRGLQAKEALPAKTLEEHKLSVEEMGRRILLENLAKAKLEPKTFENLFELLTEEKIEEAMNLLTKTRERAGKTQAPRQTRLSGP